MRPNCLLHELPRMANMVEMVVEILPGKPWEGRTRERKGQQVSIRTPGYYPKGAGEEPLRGLLARRILRHALLQILGLVGRKNADF